MENKKSPEGQGHKRLTLRLTSDLEQLIRKEAKYKGSNLNQLMLFILYKGIKLI